MDIKIHNGEVFVVPAGKVQVPMEEIEKGEYLSFESFIRGFDEWYDKPDEFELLLIELKRAAKWVEEQMYLAEIRIARTGE